ncbi:hypothetical protein F5Y16DRAFT_359364 [Xylariaceae sp. FL0255]|nr:hypothetical protein F5Y16DRAFT_359364 [Xylariaceae sp. FL0255]
MAHIASCMIDSDGETTSLRSYIANSFSAKASTDSLVSIHSTEERKPFNWRMQNQEPRKYQLFPREKQLPSVTEKKQLDLDQAFASVMSQSPDKSNGLRLRLRENNLTRRRKVSVPELEPMTTVQEAAMDSPTIPGRPALHERSISTPVNTLRHPFNPASSTAVRMDAASKGLPTTKQPLSPKDLAPLTIPSQLVPLPSLTRKLSLSRLKSGHSSSQQEPPARPPRPDESPKARTPFTPFTPFTASTTTTTPRSAATMPTPISAPDERRSPNPWEKAALGTVTSAPKTVTDNPVSFGPEVRSYSSMSHRRGQSDSGSIMERGRPRKRSDGSVIGGQHKRTESKRSLSAERRAFESLPQGFKPREAITNMDQIEVAFLQKQALGQAMRFDVLRKDDVDRLSKELRYLDERTEYIRRTYASLRAGRRNLQTRVCQYLRSPRVAKFSYESILKQEETLAELDASIDDWGTKLDHAENRRTRVRQKLLEHVAAAATLCLATDIPGAKSATSAIGSPLPGVNDVSTPPRSPVKGGVFFSPSSPSSSPSPQRVVARVPSVIPEEQNDETKSQRSHASTVGQCTLERMESIRIYADSDVYDLLADVESQFTKLEDMASSPELSSRTGVKKRSMALQRAHSYDLLSGVASVKKLSPLSPRAPSPPAKNSPTQQGVMTLTSAVFQPQQSTITA